MDTLTIDFETFYTTEYSLTKMTTQEYVQSPYFEIIGVSVKHNDQDTQWFSGDLAATKTWLQQFPWEDSVAIAHNAMFDGAVLEWVLDIKPKQWFCTRFAARPLVSPWTKHGRVSLSVIADHMGVGQKGTAVARMIGMRRADFGAAQMKEYSAYCMQDTNLTYDIYTKLWPKLPKLEQGLIHETVCKFVRPKLVLNKNVLLNRLAVVKEAKASALVDAGLLDNKMLMSNEKFAAALQALGVDPPRKISPTTGKETWAFAKTEPGMKDLLDFPDVRVQTLVAARIKHKSTLEETRLERFVKLAELQTPVGVPLTYYGAHTGRFSGSDGLNMQNLPRGGELRRAIEAPPGHKIVAGDLAQIEARITAALAGQSDLVEAFARGDDVYCMFAGEVFGRPITKADTMERFLGKTAILGLGFGMGGPKFQATLKAQADIEITTAKAWDVVKMYRRTYAQIDRLWWSCATGMKVLARGGSYQIGPVVFTKERIALPNGLNIHYPDMQIVGGEYHFRYRGHMRSIWHGAVVENIVQALARIVLGMAEMRLAQRRLHAAMQVHDELVYCVREEYAQRVAQAVELALSAPVPWLPNLPVAAEVNIGDNYLEAK